MNKLKYSISFCIGCATGAIGIIIDNPIIFYIGSIILLISIALDYGKK